MRPPLQVSLNGSRGAAEGAAVPMSPEDLVEAALAAVAAGAGELLVHPRTPCGRESLSPRVVGPLLKALRGAGTGVPVVVPAGGRGRAGSGRAAGAGPLLGVLPDRAAVHFGEPGAEELAGALLDRGVAVDAVVPLGSGTGSPQTAGGEAVGVEPLARFLAWPTPDHGRVRLVAEPAAADPALVAGLRWLPPVPVLLFGREAAAWPVLRLAARCGAGARIGLGDVRHLPDGRPARSNAELVAAAVAELAATAAPRLPLQPGAGEAFAEDVVRVGQRTVLQREAAAADAVRQMIAQAPELGDALVEFGAPGLGEPGPVLAVGRALLRQLGEGVADAGERDPDALRGAHEGHPAQRVAAVAALVAGGAAAGDQALGLVEVERGDGHAAARGELADGEFVDFSGICGTRSSVVGGPGIR